MISPLTRKNNLHEKVEQLRCLLTACDRAEIAFSGGADSSFLLGIALDVLGMDRVRILHARSCLQKKEEQERATSWPERHGYDPAKLHWRIIELTPLAWQDFTANPKNRCYLCKRRIYRMFAETLAEERVSVLMDGSNCDDLRQGEKGRPGWRAVVELGVRTPLADCGLSKAEIRALSREMQLDTWNQPSSSCLATRIPYDLEITAERLARIASLEQTVLDLGFQDCRMRLSASVDTVILQLPENKLDQFNCVQRRAVVRALRSNMGADKVEKILLDLDGR